MIIMLDDPLRRVRAVADYQFGVGVGKRLFPDNVEFSYSKSTGRIRYINLNGERLATLRPTDGFLSLSITAATFLAKNAKNIFRYFVNVRQDVSEFVARGGDVFALHVVSASDDVRARDEVIVLDQKGDLLAVGRALLSSSEMTAFKTGVAVRVRHGSRPEH